MYINFGNFGVLIGMFLVGILFRLLAQYFSAEKNNCVASAMGTSLIISLFYAESNFSQMTGGVILSFVSLYILILGLAAFLERYGQKLVLKWEK
jgi:Na+-transporting methylmalonyl-CoA/oxaloacetate decarboxylase beta subunit